MRTYILFLRGINVGGRNVLRMGDLRFLLEDLGAANVRTYIQSGNAVFLSDDADISQFGGKVREEIEERHGFAPRVFQIPLDRLKAAIASNPFPGAEPKSLHLFFLAAAPENPDIAAMENLKSGNESFVLGDEVFYLHAPDGIGRSKLAARVEKLLGVPVTVRNLRTVSKVTEMAEGI